MLIVSQDKALIVNFENINLIGLSAENNRIICSRTTNGDSQTLGKYATKERAKKVLEEIYIVFGVNRTIELFANIGNMTQVNKNNMTYTPVYQMSEE